MSKVVDLLDHDVPNLNAPLLKKISTAFEGTSFQRRLLKRLKFSLLRGVLALFLGLLLGPGLLIFGPLIVFISGRYRSLKDRKKKPAFILILMMGIITFFILTMNLTAIYYLTSDYWDLAFTAIYVPVFASFVAILLDLILEYGTNKEITVWDYLMIFCIKNAYIDLYHELDLTVHPYFERLWHYMTDYLQVNVDKKERRAYNTILIALYIILGFFFILAIPRYFDRHDGEYLVAGSIICLQSTFYIPTI
jgi:hypothetical protein